VAASTQIAPLHFYVQIGVATVLFAIWCALVLVTGFLRSNERAELWILIKTPMKWLPIARG
jgi:hypothetical protein